jgi:hypothetical protein
MKRWSYLLLDANVIIHLFKMGVWDRFVGACDVYVSETVIGEAHFYEDDSGGRHDFDLGGYVKTGSMKSFSVAPVEVKEFVDSFDPSYIEKLDAGEAESLAYLVKAHVEHLICSADAIVYRVLGNLDRGHQGASLEEVLAKVGLGRSLPWQFGKAFRERWTGAGVAERLQGRGRRSS